MTQIVAPRFGRLLTWTLGAAGLNDFLQAGFAALTNKSNELESRVPYTLAWTTCPLRPGCTSSTWEKPHSANIRWSSSAL